MDHSGFDFKSLKTANKATGYLRVSSKKMEVMPLLDSSVSYSACGLYSTIRDLFQWNSALQSG